MGLTPKQERNGIPEMEPAVNMAVTCEGPMPDVSGLIGTAQGAAATYSGYGATVFAGGDIADSDLVLGQTWEWDSGLAIAEEPGEA